MSEKKGGHLLPYGSSISAPKITVPDLGRFKNEAATRASNYFQERVESLQRQYEEVLKQAQETELVYMARYNFIPVVGKTYYLYHTGEDYILSMIENWSRFEMIGAFIFTADNVWEKV